MFRKVFHLLGPYLLGLSLPLGLYLPLLLLLPLAAAGRDHLAEEGKAELLHVQRLATQPRYGECWSRVLETVEATCRELTEERQSRMALSFTHCHLYRSGREFPACPEGSEVSHCTANMDAVAFNAYTEFFTHTHSICHFLQSEAWQLRAERTMYSLTEVSAGVAEQLGSTSRMAEDLLKAQSAALLAQEEILLNGERLRHTLRDSTQGLRELFTEMGASSREQQVALSEVFNRVAFLQNFLLLEAHTLGSGLYNAAALCTSFLLTSAQRTARARLVLMGLVCVNVYLERLIYQVVMESDHPVHQHMELVSDYVSVLRRVMVVSALLVLVLVALRYRDPTQDSLRVLAQLRETHSSLQESLRHAERLSLSVGSSREKSRLSGGGEESGEWEDLSHPPERSPYLSHPSERGHLSSSPADHTTTTSHNALLHPGWPEVSVSSARRTRNHAPHLHSPSSKACGSTPKAPGHAAEVYSFLVEERQPRYRLRSRRSETHTQTHRHTHTHTDTQTLTHKH